MYGKNTVKPVNLENENQNTGFLKNEKGALFQTRLKAI